MTLSVPKGVLKKRTMCTKLDIYVSRQLNLESDFFSDWNVSTSYTHRLIG
jgi:hypothetical protein